MTTLARPDFRPIIVDILGKYRHLTSNQLEALVGAPESTMKDRLRAMKREGLIKWLIVSRGEPVMVYLGEKGIELLKQISADNPDIKFVHFNSKHSYEHERDLSTIQMAINAALPQLNIRPVLFSRWSRQIQDDVPVNLFPRADGKKHHSINLDMFFGYQDLNRPEPNKYYFYLDMVRSESGDDKGAVIVKRKDAQGKDVYVKREKSTGVKVYALEEYARSGLFRSFLSDHLDIDCPNFRAIFVYRTKAKSDNSAKAIQKYAGEDIESSDRYWFTSLPELLSNPTGDIFTNAAGAKRGFRG